MTGNTMPDEDRGAIALAEKILAVLDEGSFTATYKYAVLLALLDLCLEKASASGEPPAVLNTRQLAEKVTEIYWPHSTPYRGQRILKQNGGRPDSQAAILSAIRRFRDRHAPDPSASLHQARFLAPDAFERLLREVEWTLIQMPLPRLQVVGEEPDPFLYRIAWGQDVKRGPVATYQRGLDSPFTNTIHLFPRVGESLVRLNSLLRPLIQQQWVRKVALLNRLEESRLEKFLFGAARIALEPVRPPLQELQANRCFYCNDTLGHATASRPEVDHFIPWVRYPNNGIENLVIAHERCNHYKRDFLATTGHVRRWRERMARQASALSDIAVRARWEHHPPETDNVARAIYLRLPDGARLWARHNEFALLDRQALRDVFR